MTDTIDNLLFFRVVEKRVRDTMQQVEQILLPVARQALVETGLSLRHDFVDIDSDTREFSRIMNTLQTNKSDYVGENTRFLHDFYSDDVFGKLQIFPTLVNRFNVLYPSEHGCVISPRTDALTLGIASWIHSPSILKSLTLANIARSAEMKISGTNLVNFGAVVDRTNRGVTGLYNPVAMALANKSGFSQVLVPTFFGSRYDVSPIVELEGNSVIRKYNDLFRKYHMPVHIESIGRHSFAHPLLLPSTQRCMRLYTYHDPFLNFHWGIKTFRGQPIVHDFWTRDIVSNSMFSDDPERYIDRQKEYVWKNLNRRF